MLHPHAKNVIAGFTGFTVGLIVNLAIVTIGMEVVPLPKEIDFSSMEALRQAMASQPVAFFLFPLLGHSLGALIGGFIAARRSACSHWKIAFAVGTAFLLVGIAMILNCGGPTWFITTDLIVSYLPMSLLGGYWGAGSRI